MLKWLSKKRNQKGFTLIELIVVIAILGILAAIAVPRFMNQTTTAKMRADQATARNIVGALNMAIAEGDAKIEGNNIYIATVADDGTKTPIPATAATAVNSDKVVESLIKLDLLDGVGNTQTDKTKAFLVQVATTDEGTVKAGGITVGITDDLSKFYPVNNN